MDWVQGGAEAEKVHASWAGLAINCKPWSASHPKPSRADAHCDCSCHPPSALLRAQSLAPGALAAALAVATSILRTKGCFWGYSSEGRRKGAGQVDRLVPSLAGGLMGFPFPELPLVVFCFRPGRSPARLAAASTPSSPMGQVNDLGGLGPFMGIVWGPLP